VTTALFPRPYGFLESKVCLTYFLVNTTVSFSANRTLTFRGGVSVVFG
jgi:hypothetical protein